MDLEKEIEAYCRLGQEIERLQEQKKALSSLIVKNMERKSVQVANYFVQRYSRLSIKLSIEEARTLGAVKMEEIVDRKKVKALYQERKIHNGVSEVHYLRVSHSSPELASKQNFEEDF